MTRRDSGSDVVRVHVRVRGRVQGVGFRYATREQAERCSVTGWVRNADSPDIVLAEVQGTQAAVAQMLAWMRRGPRWARVTALDVEPGTPIPDDRGFRILR